MNIKIIENNINNLICHNNVIDFIKNITILNIHIPKMVSS